MAVLFMCLIYAAILDCIEECDIHAICVHINGGSECICDVGYTGDGYTCAGEV